MQIGLAIGRLHLDLQVLRRILNSHLGQTIVVMSETIAKPDHYLAIGVTAKDSQTALDEFYPHYSAYFREHAPRANSAGGVPRELYEQRAGPAGPIFVGSPQQIIDKLMYERELFAHDRFLCQVDIGGLPYTKVARSIELLATVVLPAIGIAQ